MSTHDQKAGEPIGRVPIRRNGTTPYILTADIPESHRSVFLRRLGKIGMPIIPGVRPGDALYSDNYSDWHRVIEHARERLRVEDNGYELAWYRPFIKYLSPVGLAGESVVLHDPDVPEPCHAYTLGDLISGPYGLDEAIAAARATSIRAGSPSTGRGTPEGVSYAEGFLQTRSVFRIKHAHPADISPGVLPEKLALLVLRKPRQRGHRWCGAA